MKALPFPVLVLLLFSQLLLLPLLLLRLNRSSDGGLCECALLLETETITALFDGRSTPRSKSLVTSGYPVKMFNFQ